MSDPRYTIHAPTVQKLPPTQPNPRKKFSHTVKATPNQNVHGADFGAPQPIPTRRAVKRSRRRIFRLL